MSKGEALGLAIVAVCFLILLGFVSVAIVIVLCSINLIGWIVIGVILLVTLILWVGIYQYDKHYLN